MRLLRFEEDAGEFSLDEFLDGPIPPYAILSHTWGVDHEEVTFGDIMEGTGKGKPGYSKIHFCGEQAAKEGLRYFWVDTCCIDKSGTAELSEAINSMYRWYRHATKCYVYLSDVSMSGSVRNDSSFQQEWKPAFRQSRWFTRGWTLQELIAPTSVEFFSVEGERLGDKGSMAQEIQGITGISVEALRGRPMFHFSVDERLSWAEKRETKRGEDAAYSLLGIFDIHIPPIYGEGRAKAFSRLRTEIQHQELFQKNQQTLLETQRLVLVQGDMVEQQRRIMTFTVTATDAQVLVFLALRLLLKQFTDARIGQLCDDAIVARDGSI
jgi:hypothetical protein